MTLLNVHEGWLLLIPTLVALVAFVGKLIYNRYHEKE